MLWMLSSLLLLSFFDDVTIVVAAVGVVVGFDVLVLKPLLLCAL